MPSSPGDEFSVFLSCYSISSSENGWSVAALRDRGGSGMEFSWSSWKYFSENTSWKCCSKRLVGIRHLPDSPLRINLVASLLFLRYNCWIALQLLTSITLLGLGFSSVWRWIWQWVWIFSVIMSSRCSKLIQLARRRRSFRGATYSSNIHSGVASISGRFGCSVGSSGVALMPCEILFLG